MARKNRKTSHSGDLRRGTSKTAAAAARSGGWWKAHGRDVRFLGLFGGSLVLFYILTLFPIVNDYAIPKYLELNAKMSGVVLRAFGENVKSEGNSLGTIRIERGCDAIQPSALFCAAVIASPVAASARMIAVFVGTALLMTLNFVRIVSLYLVYVYFPKAFDIMHLDVWQAVFIILAVALWAFWASWQTRRQGKPTHAPV